MTRRLVASVLAIIVMAPASAGCSQPKSTRNTFLAPNRPDEPFWWERIEPLPTTVPKVESESTPESQVHAGSEAPGPMAERPGSEPCTVSFRAPADLLFAPNDATVSPGGSADLGELAETWVDAALAAEVLGSTDSRGTDEQNVDLASRRASAVAEILVRHGFDSQSITTVALGESSPVADEQGPDPDTARALNRRVDINFTVPCSIDV